MPSAVSSHQPPPVGYVLKRYPRLSETFITNEIAALERAGQPVLIFSLHAPPDGRMPDVGAIRADVHYVLASGLKARSLWEALGEGVRALAPAAPVFSRLLAAEPRQAYQALRIAVEVRRAGVTHLHAHFGTGASEVAWLAAELAGIGWSFTAHANDIYSEAVPQAELAQRMAAANGVVTVSDYNVRYLQERHGERARPASAGSTTAFRSIASAGAIRQGAPGTSPRWAGWFRRRASTCSSMPARS